jgi:hypothetical protein
LLREDLFHPVIIKRELPHPEIATMKRCPPVKRINEAVQKK